MSTTFLYTVPVLPTTDIARDVRWYEEKLGLQVYFSDPMYAVLYRENLILHLQWHADTVDDPLLGGSVVRVLVNNIQPLFEELVGLGTVERDQFKTNTPWKTNEFGFFDLNRNAIFFAEDVTG
jgi:catechol 2,3-dioxygenase-like lactoylglutathione lyase family enzyme